MISICNEDRNVQQLPLPQSLFSVNAYQNEQFFVCRKQQLLSPSPTLATVVEHLCLSLKQSLPLPLFQWQLFDLHSNIFSRELSFCQLLTRYHLYQVTTFFISSWSHHSCYFFFHFSTFQLWLFLRSHQVIFKLQLLSPLWHSTDLTVQLTKPFLGALGGLIDTSLPLSLDASEEIPLSCPHEGVFGYPNPRACDEYFQCTNGTLTHEYCPNGLLFTAETGHVVGFCAYYWNVDCPKDKIARKLLKSFKLGVVRKTNNVLYL